MLRRSACLGVDEEGRGRGVARVDGTGNLPAPPAVAVAAAAPDTTLPASAEALARSRATKKSTLGALLVVALPVATEAVVVREVEEGAVISVATATAAVGAMVAVVSVFSSLLLFSALPPW